MYELDKYTVSLLHFDDGIKDETGKVWTANGGAAVSSVKSRIGGCSLYLNGTQHISTPMTEDLKLVSNDFTIDFWMYTSNLGTSPYGSQLFNTTIANVFRGTALCYVGNTIYGGVSVNGTSWITATNTITLNEWNHIAFIKSGNNLYIAVNGVFGTPATISGTPLESSQNYAIIGNLLEASKEFHYIGYIDEFRISNIARWTEDFDPEPVKENALLRVIMLDSSERDYQLSRTEIDGFVSWFNKHASTDSTSYMLNKKVGTQNSKEYLSFDKIISFEVLGLK